MRRGSTNLLKHLTLMLLVFLSGTTTRGQAPRYEEIKAEAERRIAEGSYRQAHELYLKANELSLPPDEARWVAFRVADTMWRAQAGSRTPDTTVFEKADAQLNVLIRDAKREDDRDRVWTEVHESLGDFYWTRTDSRNWGAAWPHYQMALDWWAGSKDLDLARARYLRIVWTTASPPGRQRWEHYGYFGNMLPLPVVENALRIAVNENDRARAHYLLAMTLRSQGGDLEQRSRVVEEFEAALKPGKTTEWHDDALYHYAEWMASQGRVVMLEEGQLRQEPDYVKALELFRELLDKYTKGETRYYDQAKAQIQAITRPQLGVSVSTFYLPESEVQYQLHWRNVKRIDFALYPVDLTRHVSLAGENNHSGNWLGTINLSAREHVRAWTKDTGDKGDYRPGGESLKIEGKLPRGAYVLEARADGLAARDVVLVTDAVLVLKTSGRQALAYFANALDGSPIAGARVNVWERNNDGRTWAWRETAKDTNAEGLAVFDLLANSRHTDLFAGAMKDDRQAFSLGQGYARNAHGGDWRIYAFADRPAYRPGEKAQWKIVARRHDGSTYSTPAGEILEYQILDPRGTKAGEGRLTLNEFGSAWASLELADTMPLGEYRVTFYDQGQKHGRGQAQLFRLEEYKLPEYRVAIRTPEENGRKKAFRLGETVEVVISAEYYFGGPVADAAVEVLVYQKPFYQYWMPERDYPWLYEDLMSRRGYGGWQGQVVKRESLRTGPDGQALLTIETPRGTQQDLEYRIEARVTDSSRREVVGSERVRVTRQRYYVYPRADHNLYRPGDTVKINFKALDANGNPVETEGTVKVTRDQWIEIWAAPDGREVKGDELERLRSRKPDFAGEAGWQIKFRGYQHEDILTRIVKTNAEGESELSFAAPREGYYRVAWSSADRGGAPIRAETTVWVITNATTELGFRQGGLSIVVDKDTFRVGQKAPVMISVPVQDRWVLFTVEGEDLHSYRLVHVTGTAKLVEVDIEEKHVPNIFLSGAMVSDREIAMHTEQVVVPPVRHFLTVEVTPDHPEYLPREEGTFTVTARDHEGKPVRAEVAISVVDESVYYIQEEYAGDPRKFFFGEKRPHQVQTQSTLQQKPFFRPVTDDAKKQLYGDVREEREGQRSNRRDQFFSRGRKAGLGGEMMQDAAADSRLAAAPMAAAEMSESKLEKSKADKEQDGDEGGLAEVVQVRTDFRSTVLWEPAVMTGEDGRAVVKVQYPDALTSWRAGARAATRESRFGSGTATVRTRKPLIVRLQAPRFFVVGDAVVVSAVINNNTDRAVAVAPSLEAAGLVVKGYLKEGKLQAAPERLTIHPRSEERADWLVEATTAGEARLRAVARSDRDADAMEKTYRVHEHGIEKFLSRSGKMRGEGVLVKLDLPPRKAGSTAVTVQVTPSMAVTMLDALPYLAGYPYGCTEQTMSRFLPAAITRKTLEELRLRPEAVAEKLFGGIEAATAGKTQPGGKKDLRQLDEMVRLGLDRLYGFQHGDGGWGWWKEGESDHFMSAYVVWGLVLAQAAGIEVRSDVLVRAADYLEKEVVEEEDNPDMAAWMLHALASYHAAQKKTEIGKFEAAAFQNLWKKRDGLNAYTRALFALSAHAYGRSEEARTLIRNLENGVKVDERPDTSVVLEGPQPSQEGVMGTAHWGEDGVFWRWSDGGVEATAFALRALVTIEPNHKLIEPVTNWLVKNRRGAQWSNTRDTAICVLALNDYLKKSGELAPEVEYEVLVNGESVARSKVTTAEALSAPTRFTVAAERLRDQNEVRLVRRGGKSPLYFAVEAKFFSLEEPIQPAGSELFVRRDYVKLVPLPTLLKGHVLEREVLADEGRVRTGERVEVTLTIEAKNNLEYLVFEDLKPAGMEAVEVRSGTPLYAQELKSGAVERTKKVGFPGLARDETRFTGRTRWVYQELRDRQVALFLDKLPEGVWEIRYELRAEVPGKFHGLPVMAHAMYVPEIRANGAEIRVEVEDLKPDPMQKLRRAVVEGGAK